MCIRDRAYISQIEAMRQRIPAEPAPGCAPATRAAGRAGPLDGVWRYTDTAADLRAAVVPQGDIVPGSYGTLTVRGHRFEELVTDGGGIPAGVPVNVPGELFTFGWSRYRDVLTLSPVQGAVSPVPPKPWVMISMTPSARFLSRRCLPPAGALPP